MLCRTFLLFLLLAFPISTIGQRSPKLNLSRPNIVFILVDDLRWDELGCTGHPFVKTPNIDRIAREGAMFRKDLAQLSVLASLRLSQSVHLTLN